nr:HEAT repeat domain-containing protein [Myxococcus fulvus]
MEHLKRELAETHQRELKLRREVAELEVRVGRAQAEREESVRLTQALRGERDQLMDRLLTASRLRASTQERDDEDDDLGFDLASFISQLRSEALLKNETGKGAAATVMSMKVPVRAPAVPLAEPVAKAQPPAAASSAPPALLEPLLEGLSPVAREAQRFLQAGRLGVSAAQLAELSGQGGLGAPTDETLFGFSVRELSAQDPAARIRAAERLKALSQPAAAPALASALHAETDAAAQVALLQAFAALCREEGAQVVSPLLSSPVPEVRIAALKALLTLAPRDAAPHLAQAMKDPDRSVRRRASLLALGLEGETARRLGEEAIHDADAEVRSLAALALGAGSGENARALLLEALGDREPRVRKAAAQSLSRILGQDVSGVVALDDTHRRREIRRLATLPVKPVRARLEEPARGVPAVAVAATPVASQGAPVGAQFTTQSASVGAPQGAQFAVATQAASVGAPQGAQFAVATQGAHRSAGAVVGAAQGMQFVVAAQGAGAAQVAGSVQGGVPVALASAGARHGAMAPPLMGARPVAPPTHVAQAPQARSSVLSSTHVAQAPQARASVPSSTQGVQAPQARAPVPSQPAQPVAAPPNAGAPQRAAPPPSRPAAPAPRLSPVQAALVAMGAPAPQPATRSEEPRPVAARPSASPVETLCAPMLHEVRVAVRGRSLAELTAALGVPVELAQEAITLLSARGAVVRRGHKYFAA